LAPFAIISLAIGFPLRIVDHLFRPAFSFFGGKKSQPANKIPTMTEQQPLHIRSHNLGFVPSTMAIVGDLRDTTERAKELSKRIIKDKKAPDMIFFQESFHEDATQILCKGLQKKYPYIIHSIVPQISGFSSGALVASKYPILKADFERFQHMIGPERLSPRGILRVRFSTQQGDLLIYSVHTQALLGQERAQARLQQLRRVHEMMQEDVKNEPNVHQILIGDLNTSRLTAWGEDNLQPTGQAEEPVLKFVAENFNDPFLRDHDPVTGKRTKNTPYFLETDQQSLMQPELQEPSGTWYHGPFAKRGLLLNTKLRRDREKHHQPAPEKVVHISEQPSWGTRQWHREQTANTARFDYTLFPKNSTLEGHCEIRNIGGNRVSPSSDHLPCDLRFWSKKNRPSLLPENDKAPQQKI
jgi:endonuclease/exonuclease/phosphatase family metal-dependent hydrolase